MITGLNMKPVSFSLTSVVYEPVAQLVWSRIFSVTLNPPLMQDRFNCISDQDLNEVSLLDCLVSILLKKFFG